jgi:hypothetical protein
VTDQTEQVDVPAGTVLPKIPAGVENNGVDDWDEGGRGFPPGPQTVAPQQQAAPALPAAQSSPVQAPTPPRPPATPTPTLYSQPIGDFMLIVEADADFGPDVVVGRVQATGPGPQNQLFLHMLVVVPQSAGMMFDQDDGLRYRFIHRDMIISVVSPAEQSEVARLSQFNENLASLIAQMQQQLGLAVPQQPVVQQPAVNVDPAFGTSYTRGPF